MISRIYFQEKCGQAEGHKCFHFLRKQQKWQEIIFVSIFHLSCQKARANSSPSSLLFSGAYKNLLCDSYTFEYVQDPSELSDLLTSPGGHDYLPDCTAGQPGTYSLLNSTKGSINVGPQMNAII